MIIERLTQKIFPGKWAALEELDKKYQAVEQRLGFPAGKKRYQCLIGGHDNNTLIVERPWDSVATMEVIYTKAFADPAWQALSQEGASIVASNQTEVYGPLP